MIVSTNFTSMLRNPDKKELTPVDHLHGRLIDAIIAEDEELAKAVLKDIGTSFNYFHFFRAMIRSITHTEAIPTPEEIESIFAKCAQLIQAGEVESRASTMINA